MAAKRKVTPKAPKEAAKRSGTKKAAATRVSKATFRPKTVRLG